MILLRQTWLLLFIYLHMKGNQWLQSWENIFKKLCFAWLHGDWTFFFKKFVCQLRPEQWKHDTFTLQNVGKMANITQNTRLEDNYWLYPDWWIEMNLCFMYLKGCSQVKETVWISQYDFSVQLCVNIVIEGMSSVSVCVNPDCFQLWTLVNFPMYFYSLQKLCHHPATRPHHKGLNVRQRKWVSDTIGREREDIQILSSDGSLWKSQKRKWNLGLFFY